MGRRKKEDSTPGRRKVVTVVMLNCYKGVITVIEPTGTTGTYRQRGLINMGLEEFSRLCWVGVLENNLGNIPELPSHYRLVSTDGKNLKNFERLDMPADLGNGG